MTEQELCDAVGYSIGFNFEDNPPTQVRCDPCSATGTTCKAWFEEACFVLECGDGDGLYECTGASAGTAVEVCAYGTITSTLAIEGMNFRETERTIERFYTRGVSNVDRFDTSFSYVDSVPSTCGVVVDGTACKTCEICAEEDGTGVFPQSLDCTNIDPDFNVLTCAVGDIVTDDFLVLDGSVTRDAPADMKGMATTASSGTVSAFCERRGVTATLAMVAMFTVLV